MFFPQRVKSHTEGLSQGRVLSMVANYGKSGDSCLLPALLTFTIGVVLALSLVNSAESAENKVSDDLEIMLGKTVEITSIAFR